MRQTVGILLSIMFLPLEKGLAPIDWFEMLLSIDFDNRWRAVVIGQVKIKTKEPFFQIIKCFLSIE